VSRFAVIGHGKSPVGKRWGHHIDAYDTVVRMWDWHWQDAEDYGSKYDYGFFEAHSSVLPLFLKSNKRTPSQNWIGSLWNIKSFVDLPKNVPKGSILFDPAPYAKKATRMGACGTKKELTLTRGTIAALWAIHNATSVTLVGFDNVVAKLCLPINDGFPQAYIHEPTTFTFLGYAPGQQRHGGHDFGFERALLEHVASDRDVELVFSQEVWKCNPTSTMEK